MFDHLKRSALIAVLAAGAVAAAPAAAQDRYRDRDDRAALAIGAGIIGLAVGAAIASDNDRRYYRPRGYYYDYPRYQRTYPRYHRYDRSPPRYYRPDRWDGRRGGWDGRRHRGW